MPNRHRNYTDAAEAARRTREAIDEAAKRAKTKAKEFGQLTADKIDESRASVAEALHGASETLDDAAQQAAKSVRRAAEGLDQTANYVEEHNAGEMLSDLIGVIKRHPVPSMLIAASCGFILARTIRR